jgi:hypothetical protein
VSFSRGKGTRFETKILRRLINAGFKARRMPMGARYDIEVDGYPDLEPIRALATEPDRGQTLVTVDLNDFLGLLLYSGIAARIECKKWRSFPHHTLWKKEME